MTTGFDGRLLLPDRDEHSAPFWAACARRELAIQRCTGCGRLRHPPRPLCPWCRSADAAWRAASGRGLIWSYATPRPPLLPAYGELAEASPYNVVVVALDEDPTIRLTGNLVAAEGAAINSVDPDSIEIGQRVRVVFDQVAEEVWLPRWVRDRRPEPAPEAASGASGAAPQ